MVFILRPDGSFCVDVYEAARPDATISSPGVDDTMAVSARGVIPWAGIGLNAARAACTNAGKRLCTISEWEEACGGPSRNFYPYNAAEYDPDLCNGTDAGTGVAGATGARSLCVSPEGLLDMSGNVEEWVEGGFTRGGSFEDDDFNLRCIGAGESPSIDIPGDSVGFRCCASVLTE
jgi:formylglycine-generating enzyme required for sulfatase activity